jgi:hypothetical protein
MAKRWLRRLSWLLAVGMFSLLVYAGIVPNPLPAIWDWINRERPIAAGMEWQHRVGGRPSTAAAVGDMVVLDAGRQAQIRDRRSGDPVVEGWTADWLTVAGSGPDAVAITGRMLDRGYEVRDPVTGAVIHEDEDARAVWGFRDARLDLRCDGPRSCELRGYRPTGMQPLWSAALPGAGSGLVGPDPELAGAEVGVPSPIDAAVAGPPRLPRLLGIPLDRDRIAVVRTGTGEVLSRMDAGGDEMVLVAGGRVIRSVATRQDGICRLAVTGHDAATGVPVWGPEPYHLRTVTGGGCEQRHRPVGAGAALVAVGPEGNELVIDANDGRVLWSGGTDERVQALTEDLAVVRAADPTVRYGVVLGGDGTPIWERTVEEEAEVLLADCGAVVADRDPNQVHVWDPGSGQDVVSVLTSARVLSCAPDGLVLAQGRSIGFLLFPGAGSDSEAPLPPK